MSPIRVNADKRTTIILLLVFFLILGSAGGYLLWRVNQQTTVAPTDSDAWSQCCCDEICRMHYPNMRDCECGCPLGSTNSNGDLIDQACGDGTCEAKNCPPCNWYTEGVATCDSNWKCTCSGPRNRLGCGNTVLCEVDCPVGYTECSGNDCRGEIIPRRCDGTCSPCINPYYIIKTCMKDAPLPVNTCDGVGSSTGDIKLSPTNPENCKPISFEYTVGDTDGVGTVTVTLDGSNIAFREDLLGKTKKITGTIDGEKNCSTNTRTLKISWKDVHGAEGPDCTKTGEYTPGAAPPQPKCGDGKINQSNEECDPPGSKGTCPANLACSSKCTCPCDGEDKDSGITFTPPTVKKDGTLNYEYTMRDSKGLDVKSVSVLLNHSSLDVEKNVSPSSGTHTEATVSGKLDTSTVGKHHVLIAWKRPGESTISSACQIRGNFTVEDVGTPKWDIAKTASEECVVDSDGESIAKLTYTITIKNNGNVTGTITTVTDKLDSKVVDGSVTDISDGGTYSSSDRSIKWGQFDIPAGQTKTLTYSFTVRKDAFGVYDNVVIVKPSDGADYVANASITADCVEEPYQPPVEGGKVPDTGLFDESENLVIMGGILLFLGLGWTWLNRTYQIVNGKLVQRSKERFEQRVVKN